MIPLHVLESEELKILAHRRPALIVTLLCVAAQFNGYNNGALTMTAADGERFRLDRKARVRHLKALSVSGLIVKTKQGGLRPFGATHWALPWHPLHFRGGKRLDSPVLTHVWISQAWALENRSTGHSKGPCTDHPTGPETDPTKPPIGVTAACPSSHLNGSQSRLSPRVFPSDKAREPLGPELRAIKP